MKIDSFRCYDFYIGNDFCENQMEFLEVFPEFRLFIQTEDGIDAPSKRWKLFGTEKLRLEPEYVRITKTEELYAILLFELHEYESDLIPFDVLSILFLFIIGKIDCSELIEQIRSIEIDLNDGESPILIYDDLDPDDFETDSDNYKNEITNKILDEFDEENIDLDEEIIQCVKGMYEESASFSDLSMIYVGERYSYGRRYLPFDPDFFTSEIDIGDDFYQMPEGDPLFTKQCKRWTDYTKIVFGYEIDDVFPKEALTEGNYTFLAGKEYSIGNKCIFYYPNGINNCLKSYFSRGEIPDNQFFNSRKKTNIEITILVIPEQIKHIGRNAFRNCSIETVSFQEGVTEIGAFAFDGCRCEIKNIPDNVEKIGLTMVWEILEYAVNRKILDIQEGDLFWILSYGLDHRESKYLKILAENGYILKRFPEYPITDLLDKAIRIGFDEFVDLMLNGGLKLDYADVAHYIYNDTLEILYPLFDRGLKIDPSAYDDLITYASEQGKPEYTAWLLNRKNEDQPSKDANE